MPSHAQKMQNHNSFFESLIKAPSLEAAYAILNQKLKNFGFENVLYGFGYSTGKELSSITRSVIDDFPKEWMKRYMEKNQISKNYLVKHCLRSYDPIIWKTPAELKLEKYSNDEIIVVEEMRDFGLRAGVSFPLHLPGRGNPSTLNITYSDKDKSLKKYVENNMDSLQLIGVYFHAIVQSRLALKKLPVNIPSLSKREQEVLLWVHSHKSSKEISAIMCISERTIYWYIGMAIKKLQVRTRHEAVAKAITLGLLSP